MHDAFGAVGSAGRCGSILDGPSGIDPRMYAQLLFVMLLGVSILECIYLLVQVHAGWCGPCKWFFVHVLACCMSCTLVPHIDVFELNLESLVLV